MHSIISRGVGVARVRLVLHVAVLLLGASLSLAAAACRKEGDECAKPGGGIVLPVGDGGLGGSGGDGGGGSTPEPSYFETINCSDLVVIAAPGTGVRVELSIPNGVRLLGVTSAVIPEDGHSTPPLTPASLRFVYAKKTISEQWVTVAEAFDVIPSLPEYESPHNLTVSLGMPGKGIAIDTDTQSYAALAFGEMDTEATDVRFGRFVCYVTTQP